MIKYLVPLLALAGAAFAVYHVNSTRKVAVDAPPPIQPAEAPYGKTVAGAGMVEAQSENISVGSPLPGVVVEVKARVWDKVEPGAELFRLDDRQLRQELAVRIAQQKAAQAEVERLRNQPRDEQRPVSEAQVREAQALLTDAADALKRTQELFSKRVAPEQELLSRQQAFRVAEARLARVQAEHTMLMRGAWKYDIEIAEAAVAQAAAQVNATQIELERLVVRSQVHGNVLQVNVRPGEFVGAPASTPLVILGDLDQKHVRVDIDENDIPRFVANRPAFASVKGNSAEKFPLRFVRVEPYVVPKKSLTGQNVERVDTRVLQVIYALPPGEKRVYVGQQVEVFIEAGKVGEGSATVSSESVTMK